MKKFMKVIAMLVIAVTVASCNKKEESVPVPVQEPVKEVYQPKHEQQEVKLEGLQKYNYFQAPQTQAATSVSVDYDQKTPYGKPISVKYTYANGDTYTFVVPADFGLWKNQAGKFRVVSDDKSTVWLQGQSKKGRLMEFVFYGDPKYNGTKIKPNSYRNLPAGEIKYRK